MGKNSFVSLAALCAVMALSGPACADPDGPPPTGLGPPVEVVGEIHHDVSPALRDMPNVPSMGGLRLTPLRLLPRAPAQLLQDPVLQNTVTQNASTTPGLNFAGVGNGDYSFTPNAAPPDTNGAVGATQYVQWVNESFAVFNKTTGALVLGPLAGNTLWAGFGGGCQTNNDGDPIVQYDKAANRWIMTQFSVNTQPFLQCVAVSTTSDATGSWNRYSFAQPNFNDYPKLGVWPDGYYISFNMFSGQNFVGGRACAFDRAKMLAGLSATQVCFQTSNQFGGLLPADLDGSTPPPAGSPNYFMSLGNNNASMDLWKFHVDFTTPANSTFVNVNFAIPAFTLPCNNTGGTCVPQSGTSQQLDTLGDRLMYRLAYRNFGTYETIVANHSVTAGSGTAVRWYEIRNLSTTPTVFQSGTYAPDATSRWMGSIAMDQSGNIAVGYSASSASIFPAIRYTGRVPTDPLGTLQAENTIKLGGGSQQTNLNRWGDYSAMTVDPVDDCTFWYTNEYEKNNGSFNWSTQIASFKFPGCGASGLPTTSTAVLGAPNPSTVGQSVTFTATVTGTALPTGNVNFKDGANSIAGCTAQPLSGGGNTPQATCIVSNLTVGGHSITAVYGGDPNNQGSTSPAITQTVNSVLPPTATTLASSLNPANAGVSVTLTATVTGTAAPTGTVNFKDGASSIAGCGAQPVVFNKLVGRIATCTTSALTAGVHSLTAVYSGDANNQGSTSSPPLSQTINGAGPVPTTTAVVGVPNPSVVGQSVTFTATISGGNAPTGTVNFKDGASSIASCNLQPVASAQAQCATTVLTQGSHSITAVYSGDANNQGSTSLALTQTVNASGPAPTTTAVVGVPNPSIVGQSVIFTATISNGNAPTGTVNFKDGANSIASCNLQPVASAQAQCTTSALTQGSHSITAVYSGDANNQGSTSPALTQTVNAGGGLPTATALVSSLNPSNFGASVTFTATITGGSSPTGSVNFKDGANSIAGCATQPLVVNKLGVKATCTTSVLSAGSHSITATYSGDGTNQTSTSPPLTQTVNGAGAVPTTTVVVSSLPIAPAGTPVTFTATISGGNAPSGFVNFKDGANSIAGCNAQPVNAAQAQCTTSGLAAGKHGISAVYGGDAGNQPSTSTAIFELIM